VANTSGVLTPEDTPVLFQLWGTDEDGDTLTSTVRQVPANGKLYQVNADNVTPGAQITALNTVLTNPQGWVYYVPMPDYSSLPVADTTRYDLFDGQDYSFRITVNIGITPVNDPPVTYAKTHEVYNDLSVDLVILGLSDVDTPLSGVITELPTRGKLYRRNFDPESLITPENPAFSDNDLLYVPDEFPVRSAYTDTFKWQVTDEGYTSPEVSDTIQMVIRNQNPLADPSNPAYLPYSATDLTPITLRFHDPDGDSTAILMTLVSPPAHGTLFIRSLGGQYTALPSYPWDMPVGAGDESQVEFRVFYRPNPGYAGLDSFLYSIRDQGGLGALENPFTLFLSPPDATPPVTTDSISAVSGGYQVSLAPSDDLSGVVETRYQLDGGPETPYTGPISVTGNGEHTLHFFSKDRAGNSEAAQTLPLWIIQPNISTGQVLSVALSRASDGSIQALVTITNKTAQAMAETRITRGMLRAGPGATTYATPIPLSLGAIPAGGSASALLTFPSGTGASGAMAALSVGWSSSIGAAGTSYRLILP
jgi:hypothetical protein